MSPLRSLGWTVSVCLLAQNALDQNALAQGAGVQAIRNTAQGLEQSVQNREQPLTTGPADKQEKVAPGKIDEKAPREFTTTPSGLKYRVLRKSDRRMAKAKDSVEVHYKGWLDDGTIFDSSYRKGKTISFSLAKVIPGWTEGMQLVGEGGMIELNIPYQLGYGERGAGPIPPKSQLHFIVELVSVK